MFQSASQSIYDRILNESDIEYLIKERGEELHLDFKQLNSDPLGKDWDGIKDMLAKAISGFSNADGGVTVFGVRENKKAGDEERFAIHPVQNFVDLKRKFQEFISRATIPPNHLVLCRELASIRHPGCGYVIVHVPKSDEGPHQMSNDKKYYQRAGESHVPMAHFQIADVFGRRAKPDLRAVMFVSKNLDTQSFELELKLSNRGKAIAKYAIVLLDTTKFFSREKPVSSWFETSPLTRQKDTFVASPGKVIYPGIDVDICRFLVPFRLIAGVVDPIRTIVGTIGGENLSTRKFQLTISVSDLLARQDEPTYTIDEAKSLQLYTA